MTAIREGARLLRKASLDAIVQILKVRSNESSWGWFPVLICYSYCSRFFRLLSQCLARTAAVATGKDCYALVASWSDPSNPDDFQDENLTGVAYREKDGEKDAGVHSEHEIETREGGPGSVLSFWRNEMASHRKTHPLSYNFENQTGLLSSVTLETAFEIARKKSIKKAVEYLIACNALSTSPRDIASFLRVHKSKLDQAALGLYLGENGLDGQETEYWNLIRFSYVRAISFDGMKVEEA